SAGLTEGTNEGPCTGRSVTGALGQRHKDRLFYTRGYLRMQCAKGSGSASQLAGQDVAGRAVAAGWPAGGKCIGEGGKGVGSRRGADPLAADLLRGDIVGRAQQRFVAGTRRGGIRPSSIAYH